MNQPKQNILILKLEMVELKQLIAGLMTSFKVFASVLQARRPARPKFTACRA